MLNVTVTDRKGWPTEESFYDEKISYETFEARKDKSATIDIPKDKRVL